MYPYIERELSNGTYLGHITRHMLGLFRESRARASGVAT
jgi:tRNA-dihydrouridine synthase A